METNKSREAAIMAQVIQKENRFLYIDFEPTPTLINFNVICIFFWIFYIHNPANNDSVVSFQSVYLFLLLPYWAGWCLHDSFSQR